MEEQLQGRVLDRLRRKRAARRGRRDTADRQEARRARLQDKGVPMQGRHSRALYRPVEHLQLPSQEERIRDRGLRLPDVPASAGGHGARHHNIQYRPEEGPDQRCGRRAAVDERVEVPGVGKAAEG